VTFPLLSGVVVHWHNEALLAELVAAWPRDPRFELVVVDNGSSSPLPTGPAVLHPGSNLGFAGGANAGIEASRGEIVLILNPDAIPEPGALDQLLAGFAAWPDAAGLAPRLLGPDGKPQFPWQLGTIPSPWKCLLHALPGGGGSGLSTEPESGAPIEQPAAAALALRRNALETVGGFDAAFYPAWFEDVDLAKRFQQAGLTIRYWPAASFRHRLGSTVERLGYGSFLYLYSRNLERYLSKHHGPIWAGLGRIAVALGSLVRLAGLILYKPRRSSTRREAAKGLLAVLLGAISAWHLPRRLARESTP
jgi:GT2 family glycosyltransferase